MNWTRDLTELLRWYLVEVYFKLLEDSRKEHFWSILPSLAIIWLPSETHSSNKLFYLINITHGITFARGGASDTGRVRTLGLIRLGSESYLNYLLTVGGILVQSPNLSRLISPVIRWESHHLPRLVWEYGKNPFVLETK